MTDRDAGRTSILVFLVQIGARLVGFVGLVYFARVLPPSELGIYFLFFLLVQVSSLISGLGLGPAVTQRIGSSERPAEIFTAALLVVGAVGLLATGVIFALRGPIASYVGAEVPLVLSLAVVSWLFSHTHASAIQGEDRVLTANGLQFLEDAVRVGVGVVLLNAGFGARGLMYGVICGFAVAGILGRLLSGLPLSMPGGRDFRSLFALSRYTVVFGPTNLVYFWFDTFMIGLLLTRADVSAYEVAWQTTRVLVIPTNAIGQTILPKVARWSSAGRRDEIERILPGVLLFTLIVPLPGLVGLAVLGPDVLRLVYRPEYATAALALVILAGFMVVESVHRAGSQILLGMDRADVPFRSRLVGVVLVVVLNLALIPPFGIVGAAVATLLAKCLDALILWSGLASIVELRFPFKSLGWQAGSAVVMGVAVLALGTTLDVGSVPVLLVVVAAGVVAYGTLIMLNPDIRNVLIQYLPGR